MRLRTIIDQYLYFVAFLELESIFYQQIYNEVNIVVSESQQSFMAKIYIYNKFFCMFLTMCHWGHCIPIN